MLVPGNRSLSLVCDPHGFDVLGSEAFCFEGGLDNILTQTIQSPVNNATRESPELGPRSPVGHAPPIQHEDRFGCVRVEQRR